MAFKDVVVEWNTVQSDGSMGCTIEGIQRQCANECRLTQVRAQ